MSRILTLDRLPDAIVHAVVLSIVTMVVVAAGQPIFTDDLWWHLAIGRDYAATGPWLPNDPFLFAAERPPEAAAWLADIALHQVHRIGGFQLLRVLHALLVTGTLALAWSMLRRASGSALFASVGLGSFAAMSAYRFFQLRPDLFTMLATLAIVSLLVTGREPATRIRIGLAAIGMGFWANIHAGFVLGLVLIAAALCGEAASRWVEPWRSMRAGWGRARTLGVALGLIVVAGCLTPAGPRFLLLYMLAGTDTPELGLVSDEWAPVRLFAAPLSNVPPTPLSFALVWALLVLTPVGVGLQFLASRSARTSGSRVAAPDPALVAIAMASLVGMVSAVRLLWLAIFPLMALGQAMTAMLSGPSRARIRVGARVGAAVAAVVLAWAFVAFGDWRMISQGVRPATYRQPYSAAKYHAHGVWMMSDAGLEGNLFNDYWIGNFLGYWLSPSLKVFINGSLNVPAEVMTANTDIRTGRTDEQGRGPAELLDLHGVDVFFGTGLPTTPPSGRPMSDTTRHLESTPGWVLAFRNIHTAVYVRAAQAGRTNLERAADYYAREGVPFDAATGFDPNRVIREAPKWALVHGLVPTDFLQLQRASRGANPLDREFADDRLASIYALLGLYDLSIALDQRLAVTSSRSLQSRRRLVWALLHADRFAEAATEADRLEAIASRDDAMSRRLVRIARRLSEDPHASRAQMLAALPMFDRPQGRRITTGFAVPGARPRR